MLLISLMEMLPAALAAAGMSPVLGYGMFIVGLLGYFGLDRLLPHAHLRSGTENNAALPGSIKRTAILLTLGISLHNFPKGSQRLLPPAATSSYGIALAVALHNIPEGLAVAVRSMPYRLQTYGDILGRSRAWRNTGRRTGVVNSGELNLTGGDGGNNGGSCRLWWRCPSMNSCRWQRDRPE